MAKKPITIPATTKDPVLSQIHRILELHWEVKPKGRRESQLGEDVDRLYQLREVKKAAQKLADLTEADFKGLQNHLIDSQKKQDLQGASGEIATFNWERVDKYSIEDPDEFYKDMARRKAWDVLQRRLNEKAIKDRAEAGKPVKGLRRFRAIRVSLTKRK